MTLVGISLPLDKLQVAHRLPHPVELKLSWEDYPVLSGDRSLQNVCSEHGINAADIVTVHLPPGTTTRGREIGMAATRGNVGTVMEFVATQLDPWLPKVPLVMHPVKQVDLDEYLPVLQQYRAVTGHPVRVETPSAGRATLHDIDGVGVFCELVQRREVDGVGLVVDTAHIAGSSVDGWTPTRMVLQRYGDHVDELHLNDPVADGMPVDGTAPGLGTVLELAARQDVLCVLEPDVYEVDRVRRVVEELGFGRSDR